MKETEMIVTHGLRRNFGSGDQAVEAVKGIDLDVKAGESFALLGPNGAGKTTTLRMLTTLLPPSGGSAEVAGFDVAQQPAEVRKRIGFVSQLGGADLDATGPENLVLQGQLYGLSHSAAEARAEALSEALQLSEFIGGRARTYSGGQRRRLEVALGMMNRPTVLFLDEPTTGLDPQNRANLWDLLRRLKADGVTIVLTTHYLEEADSLSDRIVIIDHGRVIAEGTPLELKRRIAGDVVALTVHPHRVSLADLRAQFTSRAFVKEARVEGESLRLYVENGATALPIILGTLTEDGLKLEHISMSQPTLDDVFLQQTGRSLRDAAEAKER